VSDLVGSLLSELPDVDLDSAAAVRARAEQVLRPAGALRRLDDVAVHMAGWQATARPSADRPAVLVFAADHGVAAAGVSNYPSDVTAAMLAAVRAGKATVNAFARAAGATVEAFDVGVGDPTGDIRTESALTAERFAHIASVAASAVDAADAAGADVLVLGELGIGNTTISAALAAALIGGEIGRWVGRGTGVDDDGLARKRAAVDTAVRRIEGVTDPIDVLREIGGAEHAAMAVACVRARHHRIPVVLDGYIATSAMLPMHAALPGVLDHCLVGHLSSEPGHRHLLDHLGMEPLLDLGMRLGEGTGAVAALPLIRMACTGVVEVPTFAEWFGE
jgi:nicotinate-nucleotide--dimethylbenzimidazole phosphoribosyltransferase